MWDGRIPQTTTHHRVREKKERYSSSSCVNQRKATTTTETIVIIFEVCTLGCIAWVVRGTLLADLVRACSRVKRFSRHVNITTITRWLCVDGVFLRFASHISKAWAPSCHGIRSRIMMEWTLLRWSPPENDMMRGVWLISSTI